MQFLPLDLSLLLDLSFASTSHLARLLFGIHDPTVRSSKS
jgi:hypothetical protein